MLQTCAIIAVRYKYNYNNMMSLLQCYYMMSLLHCYYKYYYCSYYNMFVGRWFFKRRHLANYCPKRSKLFTNVHFRERKSLKLCAFYRLISLSFLFLFFLNLFISGKTLHYFPFNAPGKAFT